MNKQDANLSIGCSVSNCKHHCGSKQYCSLDKIKVDSDETCANTPECTCCHSFERE